MKADERRRSRLAGVLCLLLLAPVSAEYLLGYHEDFFDPGILAGSMLVFIPLYGAPAVLIREVARRRGKGWPTIIAWSAAAGLLQAGLIDQSLFNADYRGYEGWDQLWNPTEIDALGTGLWVIAAFVGGHVVQSFCAPIAVAESLSQGDPSQPWLGRAGLVTMVVLYLSGAWLVLADHVHLEGWAISPTQAAITGVAVIALVTIGAVWPQRRTQSGTAPAWAWALLAVAAVHLFSANAGTTWTATSLSLVAWAGLAALIWWWSGRRGWGQKHVLAAATAILVVNMGLAFVVDPIGDVPLARHLLVSGFFAVTVGAVLLLAWSRTRDQAS